MIYGKQKKDDTYRNFKFNSIFFFFFLEAITSRYAMLWNWTITEKLYGSIK